MFAKTRVALLLSAITLGPPAAAQDTLDAVLARMHVKESLQFHYSETRHLAMLAKPWEASGDMYITPERMVIAQRSPAPSITDITRSRLLHIDPEHQVVRTMDLATPFGVQGLKPFLQLVYGDSGADALKNRYGTSFKATGQRWQLNLYRRFDRTAVISDVLLSGNDGEGADYLKLEFDDGDLTEYHLSLTARGDAAGQAMQHVLDQAEK